jgi:DNA-binding CsgD family transcriptional regulator
VAAQVDVLVAAGNTALEAGNWDAARRSFQAALDREGSAEALFGLGSAQFWLGDMAGMLRSLEQAYAAFRRSPDAAAAAGVALQLSFHYRAHLANAAVAAGWLARGARLVESHGLEPLRGDVLLMRAYLAERPADGEAWAREALDLGRANGDPDLELSALCQLGALLVAQGRVTEGIALLDEAMAGALGGEPRRLDTVVFAACTTMVSCAHCADFARATQWVRAADAFVERYGCPFLYAECRVVYGHVLAATGEWARAEAELKAAIRLVADAVPAYHAASLATLAGLRLDQGRLEEAERLLLGFEGHASVTPVLARLYLLQGRTSLAAATAARRLDVVGQGQIESALLLEILGEAEIALGQSGAALERGRALVGLGTAHGCEVVQARGERLVANACAVADPVAAARHLDTATGIFQRLGMPYEAARTRRLLAQVLGASQPEAAEAEARTALAAFERLGAARDADAAAALLRRLGVRASRAGPRASAPLTRREQEVLALLGEGLSNPEIAARLYVSRKTAEHHVAGVLAKLGLRSRAEAAAEAVRRQRAEAAAK